MGPGERISPDGRLAGAPDLFRAPHALYPALPGGAFLSRPPADPLAAALPDGASPPPQERQSRAMVGHGHASGRAPSVLLGRAPPLDRAVASDPRHLPIAAPRLLAVA